MAGRSKASERPTSRQAIPKDAPVRHILRRHHGRENGFRAAMDNLLSYRFEDSVVIIRGFVNLDRFPSQEEISRAIDNLPTAAPESILTEKDRQDIPTSPKLLPALYNKIANQIRSPIQRAIDRFNEHHEEDIWEPRSIRNDGYNHIIHSKRVPVSRQFAVQDHHHDSHGYRPDLISCFVGLRDNTRLQVFNEHEIIWNEFTYHRGDIFLMRSHKAHRGTNYADQDNSKVFFYIDTPDMSRTADLHGKVFNVLNPDLRKWFYDQHAMETTERLLLTQATIKAKSVKRLRARQNRADACRRRANNAGRSEESGQNDQSGQSEDDSEDEHASLEPNPEDNYEDDSAEEIIPQTSSSSSSSSKGQEPPAAEDYGPLSQESSLRASAIQTENTRRAYQAAHQTGHSSSKQSISDTSQDSDADPLPRLRPRRSTDM
jgi:hypothetical protein